MKLFSSQSSKTKNDSSVSKPKTRNSANSIGVQNHVQVPVQPEAASQDIAAPQTAAPQAPQAGHKPVYPEASLSEKQLEALHKALGPAADQVPGQMNIGHGFTKNPLLDSQHTGAQDEIKIEDRSVAKIVTGVIVLVLILGAAAFAGWYYWWTTYATFEYTLHPVAVLKGQTVTPDEFLDTGEEMEGISAVYQNPGFEQVPGLQYVPLTLTLGWRTVDTAAVLYVLTPVEYIEHEYKEQGAVYRLLDFLTNAEAAASIPFTIRFTEEPLPLEEYPVGDFPLHLALNDAPFDVSLRVADTTPPTARAVNVQTVIGEEVDPEHFVTEIIDASPIYSITFAEAPDVFLQSQLTQPVRIAIEDIHGNVGMVFAEVTIELNRDPPLIEGTVETIESEVGKPVSYPQVLTAFDDFGREMEVYIDDSGVDENTEGTYTVFYWAEDLTGLRSEIAVTVHIIAVDPDYIIERADEILAGIIRDGMTQVQKVLAINNWVRWTLSSVEADEDEEVSESLKANAYKAIRDKRGDYHVFAAISELLLTRAGIPNMQIERIGDAEKSHRWNLVNPDDKGWHHFDSFPNGLGYGGNQLSMFTDKEAKTYSERIETRSKIKDYYTYDAELYPEIVKE